MHELPPAARGFVQRHMTLLAVPYRVKDQLAAAGVTGLRTVSPSVVRPLLRAVARRSVAQGHPAFHGMSVEQASQLLAFCVSDLELEAPADAAPGAAASASGGRAGAVAAAAAAAAAAALAPAVVGTMMATQIANAANAAERLFPGLLGALGGAPAGQEQADGQGRPLLDAGRLQECCGLPAPTAAGSVVVLGSQPASSHLLVYPADAPVSPLALVPASAHQQFVHDSCLLALGPLFQHPQLRSALALQYFDLQQLSKHLAVVLGSDWGSAAGGLLTPADRVAGGVGGSLAGPPRATSAPAPAGLMVRWEDGRAGGPFVSWLAQLWALATHLAAAAQAWGAVPAAAQQAAARAAAPGAAADQPQLPGARAADGAALLPWQTPEALAAAATAAQWDALGDWPLIPLANGCLLRVKHRALVLGSVSHVSQAADTGSVEHGEEQQQQEAEGRQLPGSWLHELPEPWSWLLAALQAAGCPVLDGRFSSPLAAVCGPPHLEVTAGQAACLLQKHACASDAWPLHCRRVASASSRYTLTPGRHECLQATVHST
jgi:hypothetical protein